MKLRASALLFAAAAVWLAGCSSILAPVPDRWRFFNLTPMSSSPSEAPAAWAPNGAIYGLGPVTLAAYLDRSEIAARVSPTEVTYSTIDRWAEPLSAQVATVLLQNLSSLLATNRVVAFPWQPITKVTQQIEISIRQLECGPAGQCLLDARWWVRELKGGRFLEVKETHLTRADTPDGASDAAVLSALLGELSQEIATALSANP